MTHIIRHLALGGMVLGIGSTALLPVLPSLIFTKGAAEGVATGFATQVAADTATRVLPQAATQITAGVVAVCLTGIAIAAARSGGLQAVARCERSWAWVLPVSMFLLGMLWGITSGNAMLRNRLPIACEGLRLAWQGQIESVVRYTDMPWGRAASFMFVGASSDPVCGRHARLQLFWNEPPPVSQGETWRLELVLRRPHSLANPGSGHSLLASAAVHRLAATGAVRSGARVGSVERFGFSLAARRRIVQYIDDLAFPPRVSAVLLALAVADNTRIDRKLWQWLRALGINHLLVVSGLHLGVVAGLGWLLGRVLQTVLAPWLRPAGGVLLPALFSLCSASACAAIAGFGLPVQRALIMLGVLLISRLAGGSSSPWNGLLIALLLVLLVQPLAVLSPGFWLSYGCVALLLWQAATLARTAVNGFVPWIWVALRCHFLMSLVLAPMLLAFFGATSLVAPVVNLLLVPLFCLLVVPLIVLAVFLTLAGTDCATWPWQAAGQLMQLLLQVLPESAPSTLTLQGQPGLPAVGLALVALAILLLVRGAVGRSLLLVLLLPLVVDLWLPTRPTPFQLTVLDVGQGTAVVVSVGDYHLLYDTGGGLPGGPNRAGSVVLPFLRRSGIAHLSTVVISHDDLDHSAGLDSVLTEISVGRVIRSGLPGDRHSQCRAGDAWEVPGAVGLGPVSFSFLGPLPGAIGDNDASCVLRISAAGQVFLLSGDIERSAELALVKRWGNHLASTVLLAPHHGSRTSSSWALLKMVAMREVVYSAGYRNSFGHPHAEVRRRYEALEVLQWSTAETGAVRYTIGKDGQLQRMLWRARYRRFWH